MRAALDRTPCDLLKMPICQALERVAVWLEDCEMHVLQKRPGGLPAPPFGFEAAWIVTRQAARATIGAANDSHAALPTVAAAVAKVNFALDRALREPELPLLSVGASINAILKHVADSPTQAARS